MKKLFEAIIAFFKAMFGERPDDPIGIILPPPAHEPPAQPVADGPDGGEHKVEMYLTGYGWYDNTPPGSADISHPIFHSKAGGDGSWADPITVAVGHSLATGRDVLDYPAGTIFYIPQLSRYFVVEDTCGDGPTPELGPCHCGKDGKPWIDIWCGGEGYGATACRRFQESITGNYRVIVNPGAGYVVETQPLMADGF